MREVQGVCGPCTPQETTQPLHPKRLRSSYKICFSGRSYHRKLASAILRRTIPNDLEVRNLCLNRTHPGLNLAVPIRVKRYRYHARHPPPPQIGHLLFPLAHRCHRLANNNHPVLSTRARRLCHLFHLRRIALCSLVLPIVHVAVSGRRYVWYCS